MGGGAWPRPVGAGRGPAHGVRYQVSGGVRPSMTGGLRQGGRKGVMMLRGMRFGGPCLLAAAIGAETATAQQAKLSSVRVATGLTNPLFVTAPKGDTSRLFIVEQHGSAGVLDRA